jgi:hypothetical protein
VKPARRATVLAFLRVQSPSLAVREVTAQNLRNLSQLHEWHLTEGDIVWEIRRLKAVGPPMFGVLYASPWRVQANEGAARTPLTIQILRRLPAGIGHVTWATESTGDAVSDDHGAVWLRPQAGGLESVVGPR